MTASNDSLLFPMPPRPTATVKGESARYAVRRIFCVGRNYIAHAHEMGADPTRDARFYFTKAADALVATGATVAYPPETGNYHYEMEMVVAIGAPAFRVPVEDAHKAVFGYACAPMSPS